MLLYLYLFYLLIYSTSGIIYPGMNWCGSGDISLDGISLGMYTGPDYCCRDHDSCNYIIKGLPYFLDPERLLEGSYNITFFFFVFVSQNYSRCTK